MCVCVHVCVRACKGHLGSQTLLKQDPAVLNWGRQLKLFFVCLLRAVVCVVLGLMRVI